ncbi:MAG: hypothetical protein FJX53_16785, partial [Alphaproteobacteria bacterium]|nr:hypothetical protein [Alphaproteobacteria bacterium]
LAASRSPQEWARRYSELLAAAGFPGERVTDSAEYQTLAKWQETLGELARLERVAPRLTHAQALARLRQLAADTLFQPRASAEGLSAPIQVLGILESMGLTFDHLWVSGLTEDAWPLAARPDPFLPLALQKKAGIPQSTADSALALDARITAEWQAAAGEVVFSHAVAEGDRELLPSPLIARVPAPATSTLNATSTATDVYSRGDDATGVSTGEVNAAADARANFRANVGTNADANASTKDDTWRQRIFAAGRGALEGFDDEAAPPYALAEAAGGTAVLANQAACPFRAFARHRLAAEPLDAPVAGLDAAARGQLLHALFARIWDELGSKAALEAATPERLAAIIDAAAQAALARLRAARPDLLGERFAAIERERLATLAHEWLAVERRRPDFSVIAREDRRTLQAGGLRLTGRIDRMDRLADGSHALIDYKSGRASPAGWLGERPGDPQLPLYAVNAGAGLGAVAFARIRRGDMRFDGLARTEDALPGAATVGAHRTARQFAADWQALIA